MSRPLPQVTPAPDSQRVLESIKKEKGSFVAEAVRALSSRKHLQGEFITAEALRNVIKSRYTFANELDFDVKYMNSAISRKFDGVDGALGCQGFFRLKKFSATRKSMVTLYYFAQPGKSLPEIPENNESEAWEVIFSKAANINCRFLSRSSAKRQRISDELDDSLDIAYYKMNVAKSPPITPRNIAFEFESGWLSSELKNLFAPHDGERADLALERRLQILEAAINDKNGYRKVIPSPGDPNNLYSVAEKRRLGHRCMCLSFAYREALKEMDNGLSWRACCERACTALQQAGVKGCSPEVVMRWNREFRKNDCFRHLNVFVATGVKPEPTVFALFPEAKGRLLSFATTNLSEFSLEKVREYLNTTLLPDPWQKHNREVRKDAEKSGETNKNKDLTKTEFYRDVLGIGADGLSIPTVCRYLQQLSYSYTAKKKTWYVDGHERKDVVLDRIEFCKEYLKLELRCHRWVQLTLEQATKLVDEKKLNFEEAHVFKDAEGITKYEFHVDTCKELDQYIQGEEAIRMGGNLSVRKPPGSKIVIMVGQDEAVFHQNALHRKQWVLSDGKMEILPKTDGDAIMASLFVNREDGNPLWNQDFVDKVNDARNGKHYEDKDAAMDILGTTEKPKLTLDDNPFIQYFSVGVGFDGYWNSGQMALQFEDVCDCYRVAYPCDRYEHHYFFDHSSCHDKMLDDGLNAGKMNLSFGGAKPKMRQTEITEGCLGPHDPKLKIGEKQQLVFQCGDEGPFWMSPEEREHRRHDRVTGGEKRHRLNKKELYQKLNEKSVDVPKRFIAMPELKEMCQKNGIDIEVFEEEIEEGWEGKPKGLRQVLWERGWLDPNEGGYSMKGKKDADGNLDLSKSYVHLMARCADFRREKAALHHLGDKLGVVVHSTPKYHAELAGEGIEYVWALSKNWFKRQPLSARKSRQQFKALVKRALSPKMVTAKTVRGCGRRARSYILAYAFLHDNENNEEFKKEFVDIEKTSKKYRSHRGPGDQQSGFIKKLYAEVVDEVMV